MHIVFRIFKICRRHTKFEKKSKQNQYILVLTNLKIKSINKEDTCFKESKKEGRNGIIINVVECLQNKTYITFFLK